MVLGPKASSRSEHVMDDPLLAELQRTLQREMPITVAMGIEVVSCQTSQLAMRMPLEPNRNHQYSAFAGSLNALCTIVGWGTVYVMLARQSLTGNIVIRRSNVRYLRPVCRPEFIAVSVPCEEDQEAYFMELLESKGKSKIDVSVEISDDQGPYVTFKGSYVVHLHQGSASE